MSSSSISHTRRSLTCLNRHQRLLHSLNLEYSSGRQLQHANIVTRCLTSEPVRKSEVSLPANVVAALAVDEPMELLFLGDDRRRKGEDDQDQPSLVYLFALYSAANVWLLSLSSSSSCREDVMLPDIILDPILEPFEELILSRSGGNTTNIVRIRSGQGTIGSVSIVPPGSMAMLLSDGTLALYNHPRASSGLSTSYLPITEYKLSNSWDAELDTIDPLVDFCFCVPSKDDVSASLGEFAVLLLHQSGDVYGAAPICFDGVLIQRSTLVSILSSLEEEVRVLYPPKSNLLRSSHHLVSNDDESNDAQWRQIKASITWINDVFGDLSSYDKSAHYVTSRLKNAQVRSACFWPLQVQGPLLYGRAEIGDDGASCEPALHIETLPSSRLCPLTLFAVCRQNGQVDMCSLSRPITMRFGLESNKDKEVLDERCNGSGAVLLSVTFDHDDGSQETSENDKSVTLVADPRSLGLVHVGTKKGIFSVSSGVVSGLERWFTTNGCKSSTPEFSPAAWSCLKVTGGINICGMAVIDDANLGHVLYAQLSSGSIELANISTLQYLSAATRHADDSSSKMTTKTTLNALDEFPPPFHRIIKPLVSDIAKGLSSVGKVTGNNTMPKDIGAAELATFLTIKSTLESEVILPLKELSSKTENRKSELQEIFEAQKKQLEKVNDLVLQMKNELSSLEERKKVAEENTKILAQRCAAVLEAGKDLMPNISQAESEYFNQLKRWETQCSSWNEIILKLQPKVTSICNSWTTNTKALVDLQESEIELCNSLLDGQGTNIKNANKDLDKFRRKVVWEADRLGLEIDLSS